jgi:hypothetical protein
VILALVAIITGMAMRNRGARQKDEVSKVSGQCSEKAVPSVHSRRRIKYRSSNPTAIVPGIFAPDEERPLKATLTVRTPRQTRHEEFQPGTIWIPSRVCTSPSIRKLNHRQECEDYISHWIVLTPSCAPRA